MRPARARLLLPLPDLRATVALRPANRMLGINQHDRNVLPPAPCVEAGTQTQEGDSWPNRLTSPNRPSTHWPHRGLGNDSPAEAFVIGYRNGWQQAVDLCIRIETALNDETEETNEHHQQ